MSQLSRLLQRVWANRELRTVLFFNGFGAVAGLAGNRLLTEVAAPQALGDLYLFTNLALWLTIPVSSSFVYLMHHWPIAREHGQTARFAAAMKGGLLLQTALILAGVGALRFFGAFGVTSTTVAVALIALAVGQAVYQSALPIPAAERKRILAGTMEWINGVGRSVFLAVGVMLFSSQSSTLLQLQAAHSLAIGAAGAAVILWARKLGQVQGGSQDGTRLLTLRSYFHFLAPALVSTLIAQAAASAERWGLALRGGAGATAIFVQAVGLSTAAVAAVTSILTGYFYPLITQAAAKSDRDPLAAAATPVKKLLGLSAAAFAALALGGAFFAPLATRIFFGPRYFGVSGLLPATLLGASFFGLGQALTIPLFTVRDTFSPNLARAFSLVLYAVTLVFFPIRGSVVEGFAWIYAGGQLFYCLILAGALIWHVRFRGSARSAVSN